MLNDADKLRLAEAASILRVESRNYYDKYRRYSDSEKKADYAIARENFEKYSELNKIAAELDIIAGGNL